MKRSGVRLCVLLLSLAASAAYARGIGYDGKTPITTGSGSSITLGATASSSCSGVSVETLDSLGCLPEVTSLTFSPGYLAGSNAWEEIEGSNYTAFLWPASAEPVFDSSYNGPYAQSNAVAAVFAGAGEGPCQGNANANCWSLEFDYLSVSKAGGMFPVYTPLTSCSGAAASVSIVSGTSTATYTSSSPCAINGTELQFVGDKLTGTFCTNGGSCGTPTMAGTTSAPEVDPRAATSALTLLAGCLAVLSSFGKRRLRTDPQRSSSRNARKVLQRGQAMAG